MKFFDKPLSPDEIKGIKGGYIKITADIENSWIVAGCELHADGERILLEKGSKSDNIWGGGIDLVDKKIDATAVLNLRPRLGNDSLEIMDSKTREKFVNIVREYFDELWH